MRVGDQIADANLSAAVSSLVVLVEPLAGRSRDPKRVHSMPQELLSSDPFSEQKSVKGVVRSKSAAVHFLPVSSNSDLRLNILFAPIS